MGRPARLPAVQRARAGRPGLETLIADTHAPDADYEALRARFSDEEMVKLSVAIGLINLWNRIVIGFRTVHPVE